MRGRPLNLYRAQVSLLFLTHMRQLTFEPTLPYDLSLTLTPSFISSLFIHKSGTWVKVRGVLDGLVVWQENGNISCRYFMKLDERYVKRLLGIHMPPFECRINFHDQRLNDVLRGLASVYPGLRIPSSPLDFSWIFTAVVLSRRADYEKLVLRWCTSIARITGNNPWLLLNLSRNLILSRIGSSYQILNLLDSLNSLRLILTEELGLSSDDPDELYVASQKLSECDPWRLRQLLLRCKYVGPKVADAVILTATGLSSFAPVDVHLVRVSRRLKVLAPDVSMMPRKELCLSFTCHSCPSRGECIRGYLMRKLGDLFGWYQTLTYLHGHLICKSLRPYCRTCPLKALCPENK